MRTSRHIVARTRTLLTALVAMALVFAPGVEALAQPCHNLSDVTTSLDAHIAAETSQERDTGHGERGSGYALCCAAFCVPCLPAVGSRHILQSHLATILTLQPKSETLEGLVLPPTVGPPRIPV